MYAQLKLELEADDIDYKKSSNLQGILMENIDTEYAGILHGNQLNPYSQCLIRENGKNIWCIKTLTEEAYEQIIQPMSEVKSVVFKMRSGNCWMNFMTHRVRNIWIYSLCRRQPLSRMVGM